MGIGTGKGKLLVAINQTLMPLESAVKMAMKLPFPTSNRGLNDGYSNCGTRTAF